MVKGWVWVIPTGYVLALAETPAGWLNTVGIHLYRDLEVLGFDYLISLWKVALSLKMIKV